MAVVVQISGMQKPLHVRAATGFREWDLMFEALTPVLLMFQQVLLLRLHRCQLTCLGQGLVMQPAVK